MAELPTQIIGQLLGMLGGGSSEGGSSLPGSSE
jgi:hypothetical protein